MIRIRSLRRFVLLISVGGCLMQLTGCAAGLTPVFLSLLESSVLSGLLGKLIL